MLSLRWQVSADPLRMSAIATQGMALFAVVGVGITARNIGVPVSGWYALKAGVVCTTIMAIAHQRLDSHQPHASFGPANQVTTLRAALVALVAALIGEDSSPTAAYAVAAALSAVGLDGLDGWLARRTQMATRFGARFDMEIDALLIQVLALLVWQFGKAGPWVIVSGLLRYLFMAAGWWSARLRRPLFASVRRQTICVVQVAGPMLALVPSVVPPVSNVISAVALGALCYSFAVDAEWLGRH